MVTEYDHLLYIKEIGNLLDEYKKCSDPNIQQHIYKDIVLLCEALIED
ncbi:hypothetical protein [Bacillus sp. V3-13]|nr:hypothetical protein [Bacillus sp. V3-13]